MSPRPVLVLALLSACSAPEGATIAECSDRLDNDGDGVTDCDEADCAALSVCGSLLDASDWAADAVDTTETAGGTGDTGGDAGGSADGDPVTETTTPGATVVVNELMASNDATWADPDDPTSFPDWIELFNDTNGDVDLTGYTLTDDPAQPDASPLDGLTVPAAGYLLLVADGDPDKGAAHLAFKLPADGGALGLYDPDGVALTVLDYGPQTADVSAARTADAGATWSLDTTPTPGASN